MESWRRIEKVKRPERLSNKENDYYVSDFIFGAMQCIAQRPRHYKNGRKYLESFELGCWRRIEKIKCSERLTNKEDSYYVSDFMIGTMQCIAQRLKKWAEIFGEFRNGVLEEN